MKFFKNPLRKNTGTEADKTDKPNFLTGLKNKLLPKKPDGGESEGTEFSVEALQAKLKEMMGARSDNRTRNTVLVLTGAGIAAAGVAADMMFLGGVGTITVISCLYSDLRNAQHIKKISDELGKIDEKIDALTAGNQPVPDYAPAISAVKSSIDHFQASAQKIPADAAAELERLKKQVAALQEKVAPKQPGKPSL